MQIDRKAEATTSKPPESAFTGDVQISGYFERESPSQHAIKQEIRGRASDEHRTVRQQRSTPLVASLRRFLETSLARASGKGKLAVAIRHALNRWDGLCRFLDDGRVKIDSNTVERLIRLIALNRKNALFAGSDQGSDHWAVIASLIETAKLNRVDPQAWLADTLSRLAAGHPATALDALMPWHHARAVA